MAASNVFSLEAVFAKKGDALILHYGSAKAPKMILIDGGPGGVYKSFLKPRLGQLREELELADGDPLAFEMVMVSHIDDDHINGILELFRENEAAKGAKQPVPYETKTLWHNSFGDLLGNAGAATLAQAAAAASSANAAAAFPGMKEESLAVIASTPQGVDLRRLARKLKLEVNTHFKTLVQAPAKPLDMGDGLSFTVVAPDQGRVAVLRAQWKKDLAALKNKKKKAGATAFDDNSPYNLASICVLAKMKGKSILLTGDARGDFLLQGLEQAKLIAPKKGRLHVDVLKVPHHGSDRNVEQGFFERITADHYVISGDGEHDNPSVPTLEMIREARGKAKYTIHFTIARNAHKAETNVKRKKALAAVDKWLTGKKPKSCTCVFQAADTRSVLVDLLDPLYE